MGIAIYQLKALNLKSLNLISRETLPEYKFGFCDTKLIALPVSLIFTECLWGSDPRTAKNILVGYKI